MKYDLRSLETVSSHFLFNFIFYAMWKLFKDIALCWMISFHIQQNGKRIKEALKKIFFLNTLMVFLKNAFLKTCPYTWCLLSSKTRSSHPEVFLGKDPLKICCKFTGTPMPKCDFNKVAVAITLRHGCSPVNLLHIFRTPFPRNASGRILLKNTWHKEKDWWEGFQLEKFILSLIHKSIIYFVSLNLVHKICYVRSRSKILIELDIFIKNITYFIDSIFRLYFNIISI